MKIEKYFWNLNLKALKETKNILINSDHPQFESRMITLLSRCDNAKELFSILTREKFVEVWPKIRRSWTRLGQYEDFKAWWETIYEQLISKSSKASPLGSPAKDLRFVGDMIKTTRLKLGWSQWDLAQRVHINQPDLSGIEKGKKNITLLTLLRLSKVLGIKSIPISTRILR